MAFGPPGVVWGTDSQKLVQLSTGAERVERPPESLRDELIHSLFWDETTRRLWVGTNRGLLTWDPEALAWGPRGLLNYIFLALPHNHKGAI